MAVQVRPALPVYTTGTVAANAGQAVVTGTGTSWMTTDPAGNSVASVTGGDIFVTPTQAIPIKSVDSATQITLVVPLTTGLNAGSSYSIIKYSPNLTGSVLQALIGVQQQGSDATPDLARTIDSGSGRIKLRTGPAGTLQIAVGAAGAADAALISALEFNQDGTPTNTPAIGRNALINGNFPINQRAYVSAGALAAGAYAHDRWKAGSGGCAYTFTAAVPDTTINITSGTLVQAVEASNVTATSWWLTWTGSAQARVWQGSATGVAYSSGTSRTVGGVTVNALMVSGLTIGTTTRVEFGLGTLGLVQFEAAPVAAGPTRFERRQAELALCQRYYQTSYAAGTPPGTASAAYPIAQLYCGSTQGYAPLFFGMWPVAFRALPTVVIYSDTSGASGKFNNNGTDASAYCPIVSTTFVSVNSLGVVVASQSNTSFHYTASAEL